MMDRLAEHGDEPVDFVEHVAQRHPLRVLCTILGVPEEDEDHLLELTSQLFAFDDPEVGRPGEDREAASAELAMEFFTMFNTIIEDRRANPRDDLATLLATATLDDGEPMGLVETLGYYLIVFNAGHDTTRHSLSGALGAFLDFPDQFARLKADPSLMKTAVDEVVRWSAPVNYMKRTALRDYQLDDTLIREGEAVAMFYGAANRDEEVFDDPDRFDVGRTPNRHLGFGWAEHYCLGAHLAKASIAALLEQMVERIDSIEPAGDRSVVSASFVHGYKHLPRAGELEFLMITDLSGKIAVVTGGGTGMGRELVRQLAAGGCDVAFCDLSPDTMAETAAMVAEESPDVRVLTHMADVAKEADLEAFRDAIVDGFDTDHIHLLFNNAGIAGGGSMFETERPAWERTFDVVWGGVYLGCRVFLPLVAAAPRAQWSTRRASTASTHPSDPTVPTPPTRRRSSP